MSDIEIVKKQLEDSKTQIKGIAAQFQATKQLLNESVEAAIQVRTNLFLYQQAHNELAQKNAELVKQIEGHKAQLCVLSARLLELQPPKDDEKVEPVNEPSAA